MAKSRKKGAGPSTAGEPFTEPVPQSTVDSGAADRPGSTAPQSAGDTTASAGERDRIAMRAYELYLARGRGEGAAMEDWLRAEQELNDSGPPRRDRDRER